MMKSLGDLSIFMWFVQLNHVFAHNKSIYKLNIQKYNFSIMTLNRLS